MKFVVYRENQDKTTALGIQNNSLHPETLSV